jgi:hypothetical protein
MKTHFLHSKQALFSLAIITLISLLTLSEAQAVPSFTRQTGASCSQCHTQSFGPNLTPFGRAFKLGGYTLSNGGAGSKLPAFSGMVTGSFTNTNTGVQNPDGNPDYNNNNNFTFDEASLFYAGKIYGKVGAFSQLTYDNAADIVVLDNTDIRFADNTELYDTPITYGVSLNNNPTAQDLWNTGAWGFPYTGSITQPAPGAAALVDGALGSQGGGATAYAMINNLLYVEAGSYLSFSNGFQRDIIGLPRADRQGVDGLAPYWRVALQQNWKGHYFAVGHYGMTADLYPNRLRAGGTDRYTDIAFDATYQYMANPKHIFEVKTNYIYEDQQLLASAAGAGNTYLNVFKFNAAYTFNQTYGVTFAYNKTDGSKNSIVYSTNPLTRPNSEFFTAELVYVPFGKSSSLLGSLMNLRTSLQYIGYTQFDGTEVGAGNNNTFMINAWVAF